MGFLNNQYMFSAAEDFVDVMKKYSQAVLVGNNTAGTSGQPLCEALESSGIFRICMRRCVARNGEDIYSKGFTPDIRIMPAAEDIASGRDAVPENGMGIINVYLKSSQTQNKDYPGNTQSAVPAFVHLHWSHLFRSFP